MVTLQSLAKLLDGQLFGNPEVEISGVASIEDAAPSQVSFVLEKRYQKLVEKSQAGVLITYEKLDAVPNQIVVKSPRKALAKTIDLFHIKHDNLPGIAKSADIHPTATIHPSATIEGCVVIKKGVKVGEKTLIKAGSVIEEGVIIGQDCEISSNVTIMRRTFIGNRVRVLSGAVIGEEGFGIYTEKGIHHKIPHLSSVIIEDDVEVGANTCIDRGLLRPTKIARGTKIDNLAQIGHNVQIGEDCIIVAQVGLVGSSQLMDHVTVGGQAGIDSVIIGKNSTIASKSGVTKEVPENTVVSGFPAQPHQQELRERAILKRLIKNATKKREENPHEV